MEWLLLSEKCIWFGLAAVGFAVLFNVPSRTLLPVFIMGALGGITKVLLMGTDVNIIISTFCGSAIIGVLSIPFAHYKHSPPAIFAIPAVIPLVPGILAYRMMLGLIDLAGGNPLKISEQILSDTLHNGLTVMFILMSLAAGVALPMLITRKESAKQLRFTKPGKRTLE